MAAVQESSPAAVQFDPSEIVAGVCRATLHAIARAADAGQVASPTARTAVIQVAFALMDDAAVQTLELHEREPVLQPLRQLVADFVNGL